VECAFQAENVFYTIVPVGRHLPSRLELEKRGSSSLVIVIQPLDIDLGLEGFPLQQC